MDYISSHYGDHIMLLLEALYSKLLPDFITDIMVMGAIENSTDRIAQILCSDAATPLLPRILSLVFFKMKNYTKILNPEA